MMSIFETARVANQNLVDIAGLVFYNAEIMEQCHNRGETMRKLNNANDLALIEDKLSKALKIIEKLRKLE